MISTQQPGLYRRLTVRLLLPMLILVSGGGALGVYASTKLTSEVFDRWLLDAAVSLAQQVTGDGDAVKVDMPRSSQSMLAYDEIDQTFFSVEKNGALLLGTTGIPQAARTRSSILADTHTTARSGAGKCAWHPRVRAARTAAASRCSSPRRS